MRLSTTALSTPSVLPVSLAEFKDYARIDTADEDANAMAFIAAATARAEDITDRPLISRQYKAKFDGFASVMELDRLPVASVDVVNYFDTAGTEQVLASSVYLVDLGGDHRNARVYIAPNQSWPSVQIGRLDAVSITFTAGFGADWNAVPETIRQAIKYLALHYFDKRDAVNIGNIVNEVDQTAKSLLAPYRVISL